MLEEKRENQQQTQPQPHWHRHEASALTIAYHASLRGFCVVKNLVFANIERVA